MARPYPPPYLHCTYLDKRSLGYSGLLTLYIKSSLRAGVLPLDIRFFIYPVRCVLEWTRSANFQ